ncbi:MAG: hypothetical protein ACW99Q_18095 [Candidatus Kariarchaeaceae archaeon]|jgi:hypothetical protein
MRVFNPQSKKKAILGFFFGFILVFQLVFPSNLIYIRKNDYSSIKLVFSGRGYNELTENNTTVSGDSSYQNITIQAPGLIGNASISGFKSEEGRLRSSLYQPSPFLGLVHKYSSRTIKWWPYWLNSTDFLWISSFEPILLSLRYTVQPLTYGYNTSFVPWNLDINYLLSVPLQAFVSPSENGEWLIHGEHNGMSLQGQFTSRSLNLVYDPNGFLLRMSGSSFFQLENNNSFEHGFIWNRIEFHSIPNSGTEFSLWDFLSLPINVLFGSVVLILISLGFYFRFKKGKKR